MFFLFEFEEAQGNKPGFAFDAHHVEKVGLRGELFVGKIGRFFFGVSQVD